MSTIRNIRESLNRALISSPVATFYDYTFQNSNISLNCFGVTAAMDFINNFDWGKHPAEQISQSVSGAIVGIFLPQILKNLVESAIGNPGVSLAIALAITSLTLKHGIDICDKLAPPAKPFIPKRLTLAEQRALRDAELKRLDEFISKRNSQEEEEDKWLSDKFPTWKQN